jgi:hypothetical protein
MLCQTAFWLVQWSNGIPTGQILSVSNGWQSWTLAHWADTQPSRKEVHPILSWLVRASCTPGKHVHCGYCCVFSNQEVKHDIMTWHASASVSVSCKWLWSFIILFDFNTQASGAWHNPMCQASSTSPQLGHSSMWEQPHSSSLAFTPQRPEMCLATQCWWVLPIPLSLPASMGAMI